MNGKRQASEPYRCPVCGKELKTTAGFRSHLERHVFPKGTEAWLREQGYTQPVKIKCAYCGRTIRRDTKPYRDYDGQTYHRSCFREMTDSSYEKPVLGRTR